jgi:hypothetical protein
MLQSCRTLGGHILASSIQVRLDHDTSDSRGVGSAGLKLLADVGDHFGLIAVVLLRIAICITYISKLLHFCRQKLCRRDEIGSGHDSWQMRAATRKATSGDMTERTATIYHDARCPFWSFLGDGRRGRTDMLRRVIRAARPTAQDDMHVLISGGLHD